MNSGGSKPIQVDKSPINDFNGSYQFLNNDHPSWVNLEGLLFASASIAYQAARSNNPQIRKSLQTVQNYAEFQQICMKIMNPLNWSSMKHKTMERIVRDKFKRSKQLGNKLMATHPRTLINSFKEGGQNQQYWGVVNGIGQNYLGKILMSIRQQIIDKIDWNCWIQDQGLQSEHKIKTKLSLTVLKQDKPIDKLYLQKKNKFYFGSDEGNDYKLEHPSISKTHACIYFGMNSQIMIVDLGSSNGTIIMRDGSKIKLQNCMPQKMQNGDVVLFGLSSRSYRVQINKIETQQLNQSRNSHYSVIAQSLKQKQVDQPKRQKQRVRYQQRQRSRSRSKSQKHKKNSRKHHR